jgi:hypothetical protein
MVRQGVIGCTCTADQSVHNYEWAEGNPSCAGHIPETVRADSSPCCIRVVYPSSSWLFFLTRVISQFVCALHASLTTSLPWLPQYPPATYHCCNLGSQLHLQLALGHTSTSGPVGTFHAPEDAPLSIGRPLGTGSVLVVTEMQNRLNTLSPLHQEQEKLLRAQTNRIA